MSVSSVIRNIYRSSYIIYKSGIITRSTIARNPFWATSRRCHDEVLHKLTDSNMIYCPNLIKYFKNRYVLKYVIEDHLDAKFCLQEFIHNSKKTVETITEQISTGSTRNLEGLVTEAGIAQVRQGLRKMSLKQMSQLAIQRHDILFSFLYEITCTFPQTDDPTKCVVELTMGYHLIRGIKDLMESDKPESVTVAFFSNNYFVLNYSFSRDFSLGINNSTWVITSLNHFKPIMAF